MTTGSATPVPHAQTHPLAAALIGHALAWHGKRRAPGLQRAYEAQPDSFFRDIEAEVAATLRASGQAMSECLADLDAFNALTQDTENDAWYDRPAAFSSMHLDALLLGFARRRLGVIVEHLREPAVEEAIVLDVGGGSGRLLSTLLQEHVAWQAVLVDRSAAAVSFSRAYFDAIGLGRRAQSRHGDLTALPFADASFDIVVAAEVLEHTNDAPAAAAELLRVLRPGGRLAISLPIDLDIAMHPTVFATKEDILGFFGRLPLRLLQNEIVLPDDTLDAICDVFPDFKGCLNATFVHDSAPR